MVAVYQRAAAEGRPPVKAVVDECGVQRWTAARLLQRARDRGMLPKVGSGARVERNAKCLHVADALGVDYDDLVAAVRQVGGDIRVR